MSKKDGLVDYKTLGPGVIRAADGITLSQALWHAQTDFEANGKTQFQITWHDKRKKK